MDASFGDRLKMQLLRGARYVNRASLQQWSKLTLRRRHADSGRVSIVSAAGHYGEPGLPEGLWVPTRVPDAAKLGLGYVLPYYYLTGSVLDLLKAWPLNGAVQWSEDAPSNSFFPENREGWTHTQDDECFGMLRLQGPNPFLLQKSGREFVVDYGPWFEGVREPVSCRFSYRAGRLKPLSIEVDGTGAKPGDADWECFKVVANGLDVRHAILVSHLLECHLVVGQSFALSRFSLPVGHPLREFLRIYTHGTLQVNDFAYRLLLQPSSYFLQSHLFSKEGAHRVLDNAIRRFRIDSYVLPKNLERRGIAGLRRHPWVEDASDAWDCMSDYCSELVEHWYPDEASMAGDEDLQTWHATLMRLLPNEEPSELRDPSRLAELLACLLFNAVIHEVSGDFSPYSASAEPEAKQVVNLDTVAARGLDGPITVNDVFLFDQGAFASSFNVGGNNMIDVPLSRLTEDPHLAAITQRFRDALVQLEDVVNERNAGRWRPLRRTRPSQWELSASF